MIISNYTDDFQYKIFGYLFLENTFEEDESKKGGKIFVEKIMTMLKPDIFSKDDIRSLFVILKNYFNKYHNFPDTKIFLQELKNNSSMDNDKFEYQKSIFTKCLKSINEEEVQYVRDNIENNIRNLLTLNAVNKIKNNLEQGKITNEKDFKKIEAEIIESTAFKLDVDEDLEVFDNFENILTDSYRSPIPTGIDFLDKDTRGGLARGELGLVMCAFGVGKTTILSKMANSAYRNNFNVVQIVFEDKQEEIKSKHYAIFSELDSRELVKNQEIVKSSIAKERELHPNNHLIIKRMPSSNTTLLTIKNFLNKVRRQYNIEIDLLIVDYVDCLSAIKSDGLEGEKEVMRGLESMCADENIAIWAATQSNRSGVDQSKLTGQQIGGSIAKGQIAHLFLTFGKDEDQKINKRATCCFIKSRIGRDGHCYEDIVFDNAKLTICESEYTQTLQIPTSDPIYRELHGITPDKEEEQKYNHNPELDIATAALRELMEKSNLFSKPVEN